MKIPTQEDIDHDYEIYAQGLGVSVEQVKREMSGEPFIDPDKLKEAECYMKRDGLIDPREAEFLHIHKKNTSGLGIDVDKVYFSKPIHRGGIPFKFVLESRKQEEAMIRAFFPERFPKLTWWQRIKRFFRREK